MENANNKNNYLNDPEIIQKFKKSYLTSLNVFLDDSSFKEKITSLPKLKSTTISKFEKMFDKIKEQNKENEKNKKRDKSNTEKMKPSLSKSPDKSKLKYNIIY